MINIFPLIAGYALAYSVHTDRGRAMAKQAITYFMKNAEEAEKTAFTAIQKALEPRKENENDGRSSM